MHIPKGTTAEVEVLTFADALAAANTPNPDYDIEKWLYAPNFYSEYRYILGTRGSNPLICIGINPSTAKPDDLDNTLKSVERIALGNGFDSFIMFNVYAQRATNPDDMEEKFILNLIHRPELAPEYAEKVTGQGKKEEAEKYITELESMEKLYNIFSMKLGGTTDIKFVRPKQTRHLFCLGRFCVIAE